MERALKPLVPVAYGMESYATLGARLSKIAKTAPSHEASYTPTHRAIISLR